ncbi:ABC transporter ATP-binding protein [Deinococcus roseus]|uniref:ABC transporter ATP-binding protein n=1 Tax=Deinococcus roseus TaxID=392414 RepID=A0ABQ2D3I1_9DEIO|nr:ABC transporter ATP-binding protein [Deinococcus roseus]GGJ35921.1 ABC transporter ATP-binding protein [Deinococcus roseus]
MQTQPSPMTDFSSLAPILQARNISVTFGNNLAVSQVDLTLRPGEIIGLIGPNGAGKTTFFNALTGFVKKTGTVMFQGKDISRTPAYDLPRLGIARTFQVERPFEDMTVLENVTISSFLKHPATRDARSHAQNTLQRVGLLDRADQKCSELNLARRRRLEVAKALALEPKVLFLDEVIAGLNPPAQAEMIGIIRGLAQEGMGIVMVEHIMKVIMGLSNHVICLAFGKKLAEGTPQQVASNPEVIAAYLGGDDD